MWKHESCCAGNEVQQEVQAEDNMQKEQQAGAEGNAETELQTEAVPENTAEAVTGRRENTEWNGGRDQRFYVYCDR